MVLFHGLVRANAARHVGEAGARRAAVLSYGCELAFFALEVGAWGSQPLFVNNALAMFWCGVMMAMLLRHSPPTGGKRD